MNGALIGITAARRAPEQAALVRALGGEPLVGSTIDLDSAVSDEQIVPELTRLAHEGFAALIAMTGVGMRHLLAAADRAQVGEQLRARCADARVFARGAKARRTLRSFGIAVERVAEPASSEGVLAMVTTELTQPSRVVLQSALPHDDPLTVQIGRLGHEITTLHPYTIAPRGDAEPAIALAYAALDGRLAAVTFTSANAVSGMAAICEHEGLDLSAIGPEVLVAAVGTVTAAALRDHGVRVDVEPATPRMGAMYQALAARLRQAS